MSTAASTRWAFDLGRLRCVPAAVLRRPGGPGRGAAVPAQRDARSRCLRTTGWPRWPSTTSTSAGSRRSTSRTGRCSPRSRDDFAAHGLELPLYWGNRNWYPYVADTVRTMVADGVARALVLATSATSSYSGCRQYRENLADAQAELAGRRRPELVQAAALSSTTPASSPPTPTGCGPPSTSCRPTGARVPGLVFTAHSIPESMNAASGPRRRPVPRRAPRDRAPGGRGGARAGGRVRPGLAVPLRSAPRAVARARYQRSPADAGRRRCGGRRRGPTGFVSDHLEVRWDLDTEARETAAELGLPFARAAHRRHPSSLRGHGAGAGRGGAVRRAAASTGDIGHLRVELPRGVLPATVSAFSAGPGPGQARVLSRTNRTTTPTAKIARPATMPATGSVTTSPAQPIIPATCTVRGYRRSWPIWVNAARFAIR